MLYKSIIPGTIIIAIVTSVYWWSGDQATGTATMKIETASIERGDIRRSVATSGSVRALVTVEVGSQLSGQIAEIHADYNTPVKKGQIIALIDPQTFATRVLQNKADLDVANANIAVQRASIDRAKANLRKARLEHERTKPLVKKGTLPESDLDTTLANYESARADVSMAEAQLENALATKEQRKATLDSAKIDLERTRIRSPIDGVVIERAVDQGQTVAASLSSPILFNIAQDLTEIQIEANVDEADIGNIKEGNEATFSVDAYPETEFSGQVDQVRLAPNELNNVVTYTVIITAKNPDLKLLPGMTAIVEIVTGKSEDVLRVSNDAIRFRPPQDSELAKLQSQSQVGAGSLTERPHGGYGGAPPGGLGRADINQLALTLNLNDEQKEAIGTDIKAIFSDMRSGGGGRGMRMPGGSDMSAMREQRQQLSKQITKRIAQIYERRLTPDQYLHYQRIQRQQEETRSGQIWLQSVNGEIKPFHVQLGISDDSFTEIISQDLTEGDQAVTRIRKARN